MILTLMVMALVTALATTVSVVTLNNLQSSTRAQLAGSALNAADAGLAQAMSYLRRSGVRDLRCYATSTCAANSWGNRTSPTTVAVSGKAGQSYSVWIEPVAPFPANDPGLYRIHSTGRAAGSAARMVTVDVGVTTSPIPRGIFARSINGGGSASVQRQSIFSTGCVYDRSKIDMAPGEMDLAYGIPIGVHSAQTITESNGTGELCSTTSKPIHKNGLRCNPSYPYDQDSRGGSLLGTTCASTQTTYPDYYGPKNLDGIAGNEVDGSYIKDAATLFKLFNISDPPRLSESQIDQLRATAQEQGNYWTSSAGWASPDESNAVMFFDLAGANLGGTVNLNGITGFGRAANLADSSPACSTKSLTIVIVDGNASMNSNLSLVASLFLTSRDPYGQVTRANGTADFIGTIFADKVNLVGNVDLSMDTCFLANVSPALLSLTPGAYRELDR
jgi:hypothetical protein